jgi:hypothetical protein
MAHFLGYSAYVCSPTWALSLSCTISGGLGYFMGNRLKNQQVFWLCLFNLMMLVFVGVVAPGFCTSHVLY